MQIQSVCTLLVYTQTVENTFRNEKNKSHTLATKTDLTYSFSKIFKLSHSVESLQSGSSACIDLLGGPEQSYTHMPQSVNVFCCSGRGCALFTPLFVAQKFVSSIWWTFPYFAKQHLFLPKKLQVQKQLCPIQLCQHGQMSFIFHGSQGLYTMAAASVIAKLKLKPV